MVAYLWFDNWVNVMPPWYSRSVAKSCLTLCNPVNCNSLPGSSVHGIFQARILEWVASSSSRGSSRPRDWTCPSCITGRFFTTEPPGIVNIDKAGLQSLWWEDVRNELGFELAGLHIQRLNCIYSLYQNLPYLQLFNTCVCLISIWWVDEWVPVEQAACKGPGGSIVCLQYSGPEIV